MATGLKALPFSFGAHFLALVATIMVLVWSIHFRGGFAWEADNKNLIFNIHPVLMLIGFIILAILFVYVMTGGNACLGFLRSLHSLKLTVWLYGSDAFQVDFTAIATVLYGVFVFLTIFSQAPTVDDYGYSAIS